MFAHTCTMEKVRKVYRFLKKKYDLLVFRKYTTLAGMLVFFLIMSIMPLSFWLTLIIGRLPVDTEKILALSVFDGVKNALTYVQKEAREATVGASFILLLTSLYSATNLFYQMRRSGEIIYDYRKKRQGLRMRVGALVLLILVMAVTVIFLLTFALGSFLFSRIFSHVFQRIADYVLLIAVAFLLVLLLNMYICPYKEKIRSFLSGTLLTVVFWIIAIVGFSIYLKIGNVSRLYGALSTIIVFLLWLYVLMIGFVVGVIFNSERILEKRKKRNGAHKKKSDATYCKQ